MKLQTAQRTRFKLATAMAATLLVASAAHADSESGKLKLAAYMDAASGEQLLAGNYTAVIAKLAPHASEYSSDSVAASTNLCVAYVATGQLDAARIACDEAIKAAQLDSGTERMTLSERIAHDDQVTLAYANRAVLTKLSGE
jgi:ABC-type proline/glycine betaine transport system substrate-binding protein